MQDRTPDRGHLLPALLLSALIVLLAPFAGVLQQRLRTLVGEGYRSALAVIFLVALLGLLAAALVRARRRAFWPRAGLILLAVALMTLQVAGWNRSDAAVNAVERLHFLYFGLLALCFHRHFRRRGDWSMFPLTLIAVTLVGLADESLQFVLAVRVGDGLDVALNAYAGLCGLLVAIAVMPPEIPLRALSPGSARLLAGATGALVLFLGMFVDRLHTGHEICAPDLDACFRSAYTAAELERLARSRAESWRRRPPTRPGPLALEDHYQTEAMRHVLFRGAALRRGDLETAWRENQLLERYFAPFLALGSGWTAEQRQRIEARRAESAASPYVSPVFRSYARKLFIRRSRPVYWGIVAAVVLACWLPLWKRTSIAPRPPSP